MSDGPAARGRSADDVGNFSTDLRRLLGSATFWGSHHLKRARGNRVTLPHERGRVPAGGQSATTKRKSHEHRRLYPGPIDYWMLITDWRNGSIAILLVIGAFVIGYAFRTGSLVVPSPPTAALPTHASPAIAEGEVEEGNAGQTPRVRAVQTMGHPERVKE